MSTKPVAENSRSQGQSERRTRPRYALVTSIRAHAKCPDRVIRSQGMTVEISEGGVSAYLQGEFEAGQQVELELDLPTGPLELSAIVRNCLGHRFGFQFLELLPEQCHKIFFFNDTATTEIYTLSLHDALPIWTFRIAYPKEIARYLVFKGSVAVEGISLTISNLTDDYFEIAVIPKTWEVTNFSQLKPGDEVNLEVDVIAKYVERILSVQSPNSKSPA